MKSFFKMLLASILGVIAGLGCLGFMIIPMIIASIAAMVSGNDSSKVDIKANTILKVELDMISEVVNENPLDQLLNTDASTPISLSDALRAIHSAKNNPNISGIYIDAEDVSSGMASLDEIRTAIEDFKESGKFVVAYADSYSQKGYYLASVADHILINPLGELSLVGIASSNLMYKGLLDKIGVKAEVFKVGTYKSAVEPYILEHISDANREQIETYIGGLWTDMLETLSETTGKDTAELQMLVNSGIAFEEATKLPSIGLVDSVIYRNEVSSLIAKLLGDDFNPKDLKMISLSDLARTLREDTPTTGGKISVLTMEGEIMPDQVSQFGSGEQFIGESYVDKIKELRENEDVKAVVLRINSPGGSAFISEQIYEEVRKLSTTKPVVTSMGDVVASGGYYIASASNYIMAGPKTLTGSIGIFGVLQNASELARRAGVTLDIVKTNKYADYASIGMLLHPLAPDQRAVIQGQVERGYKIFLDRVSRGRSMTIEQVDSVGQGRIWLGKKAKELGLVDEFGGLTEAINKAAQLAQLESYSVDYGSTTHNLLEELLGKNLSSDSFVARAKYLFMSPAERELIKLLDRHTSGFDLKARLPYEIAPY